MPSKLSGKTILVTGTAGFIGFHLVRKLLETGARIVGLDSINDYYDPVLKKARLAENGIAAEKIRYNRLVQSSHSKPYRFIKLELEDSGNLLSLFSREKFDLVVNLAAQAGVRYSFTHPDVYIGSNIKGFLNILEACRHHPVEHLVYASSSSVYGLNRVMPFSVRQNVDHPASLYAASKKSNELMAHAYSHLFNMPVTGLRFFTVYGPWGRPDMALFLFTKNILEDKPIDVFNYGKHRRDFTYIDDIVEGVVRVLDQIPEPNTNWDGMAPDSATSYAPYRLYNIGNNQPVDLSHYIEVIEKKLGKTAKKNFLPLQPGDVPDTYADVADLVKDVGFKPQTTVEEGISLFIDWYREYFKV